MNTTVEFNLLTVIHNQRESFPFIYIIFLLTSMNYLLLDHETFKVVVKHNIQCIQVLYKCSVQ